MNLHTWVKYLPTEHELDVPKSEKKTQFLLVVSAYPNIEIIQWPGWLNQEWHNIECNWHWLLGQVLIFFGTSYWPFYGTGHMQHAICLQSSDHHSRHTMMKKVHMAKPSSIRKRHPMKISTVRESNIGYVELLRLGSANAHLKIILKHEWRNTKIKYLLCHR
jgi:hypothetical protein